MWYLQNENDERVIYIAGKNSEITIGRNTDPQINCFVIPDDPSISRKHATLCNLNGELFLQDLGSRYGTFLNNNNDKVESQSMIKLKDGDIVKFGKMNSVFKVFFKSFVTCTSTLKGENLQNLRQCLNNLSGTLKNEWDENCQYLTMPAITLTMKVVLALVQGAHIVTVEFWNKSLEALNSQVVLPDPNNYTPQVIESTLNKENVTFLPNDRRRTLFSGKRVLFFSKRQFEMYKTVLTNASANALLLSECKMTKSALCENNVIVIQYNISAASQETQAQKILIEEILNYLKSKGKRLITDVEIGLAVLYCSTEKYCNPDFQFPAEIIKQSEQNTKLNNVLAQESQESNQNIQSHRENVVIDETLTTINSAENIKCINMKRKNCDGYEAQENAQKKMALDKCIEDASNSGVKRKINEDDIDTNPLKKMASDFESTDSQDNFNFVSTVSTNYTDKHQETSTKTLNLIKPQKRKLESDDNEDDPFQFVTNKPKIPFLNKSNLFDNDRDTENIQKAKESETMTENTKSMISNNADLTSLRGIKLEELMKNNEKLISNDRINQFKTPIKEELDEKMSELNLGITIVTIKKELIIKKEPKLVEEKNHNVRDFKKFKKVWPVKMQISLISTSSNSTIDKLSSTNELQNCVTQNAK